MHSHTLCCGTKTVKFIVSLLFLIPLILWSNLVHSFVILHIVTIWFFFLSHSFIWLPCSIKLMYYYLKQKEIDPPSCQNIKFKSLIQFISYTFIYSYHTSSHASPVTPSHVLSHISMLNNIIISHLFQSYFINFDCITSLLIMSHTTYSEHQLSPFAPSHFPIWCSVTKPLKLACILDSLALL